MTVMVQVADLSHENFKSSHEVVTQSTSKSFLVPSQVVNANPSDSPHCQCWIKNLSILLSLQYKENNGKFAASNGRLKAKSFPAPGPRWGLRLRPRYRLALPRSHKRPLFDPHFSLPSAAPGWHTVPNGMTEGSASKGCTTMVNLRSRSCRGGST